MKSKKLVSSDGQQSHSHLKGLSEAVAANKEAAAAEVDEQIDINSLLDGDSSPSIRPLPQRRPRGSHCPWSSDTVKFMTNLHKEACELRERIVKTSCDAAVFENQNKRLTEENQKLLKENASLRKHIDELQVSQHELQAEKQRRLLAEQKLAKLIGSAERSSPSVAAK